MNYMFIRRDFSLFVFAMLAVALMAAFQNCGKGFSTRLAGENQEDLTSQPPPIASPISIEITALPAAKLSETVFFSQMNKANVANFKQFEPQFPLYSDNSTKRRWIYLPKDEKIDTSNLDQWVFPTGTILWKEFSIDDRKVETRVLEKIAAGQGPTAWRSSSYLWKIDQSDADLLDPVTGDTFYTNPIPAQDIYEARAVQTKYRIATPSLCISCHRGNTDFSLGFSYLQLSSNTKAVNIFTLGAQGLFTAPPIKADELPGSAVDKAALGYIQANCAHCHNGVSGPPHNFRHNSGVSTLNNEPIILAAMAFPDLIVEGSPTTSLVFRRFLGQPAVEGGPTLQRMPRLGTSIIDPVGEQVLGDWIRSINLP